MTVLDREGGQSLPYDYGPTSGSASPEPTDPGHQEPQSDHPGTSVQGDAGGSDGTGPLSKTFVIDINKFVNVLRRADDKPMSFQEKVTAARRLIDALQAGRTALAATNSSKKDRK